MVNYIIRRKKKNKTRYYYLPYSPIKNPLRSNLIFDKIKYKLKKWKIARSFKFLVDGILFRRFAPNLDYVIKYNYLINGNEKIKIIQETQETQDNENISENNEFVESNTLKNFINYNEKDTSKNFINYNEKDTSKNFINYNEKNEKLQNLKDKVNVFIRKKINKYIQLLKYKAKLNLVIQLKHFFRFKNLKTFKKKFVYKHITTHFNNFDTNYEMILLRLGVVNSMKAARVYIKRGVVKINNFRKYVTRHLNTFDFFQFTKTPVDVVNKFTGYLTKFRKYLNGYRGMTLKIIDLLCLFANQKNYSMFLGFLPFTSPFNFQTFSFLQFNKIDKNQWHYHLDFYVVKKFLQYGR